MTGKSPYKLVYGHDAILPVEVNLQSVRLQRQNNFPIEHYHQMVFDELDGLHDERLIALENLIRQKEITARFYDS